MAVADFLSASVGVLGRLWLPSLSWAVLGILYGSWGVVERKFVNGGWSQEE